MPNAEAAKALNRLTQAIARRVPREGADRATVEALAAQAATPTERKTPEQIAQQAQDDVVAHLMSIAPGAPVDRSEIDKLVEQ